MARFALLVDTSDPEVIDRIKEGFAALRDASGDLEASMFEIDTNGRSGNAVWRAGRETETSP